MATKSLIKFALYSTDIGRESNALVLNRPFSCSSCESEYGALASLKFPSIRFYSFFFLQEQHVWRLHTVGVGLGSICEFFGGHNKRGTQLKGTIACGNI